MDAAESPGGYDAVLVYLNGEWTAFPCGLFDTAGTRIFVNKIPVSLESKRFLRLLVTIEY